MPSRPVPFTNQYFYHLFNRGVNKQPIFEGPGEYDRFLQTLFYYQFSGPKPRFSTHKRFRQKDFTSNEKIIEIICYCLMPNHFHLLIRQLRDGGIVEFMGKMANSYTKYFNTKHRRVGPLLQGEFKSVIMGNDEQLLHVSRYIHLNPYVASIVEDLESYPYSSYPDFIGLTNSQVCVTEPILSFFKNPQDYQGFVNDHQDYAKQIGFMKHLLIEEE